MEAPRLLDRIRMAIRARHYSIRTEEAYVMWARRYILFHGKKHPSAMGAEEINAFLTHLPVERNVSASTRGAGAERAPVSLQGGAERGGGVDRRPRAGGQAEEAAGGLHAPRNCGDPRLDEWDAEADCGVAVRDGATSHRRGTATGQRCGLRKERDPDPGSERGERTEEPCSRG